MWGRTILAAGLLCLGVSGAEKVEVPKFTTTPRKVVVFKNGSAFVVRSGQAKVQGGKADMPALPPSSLGALWFTTDDPTKKIQEVSTLEYKESVEIDPANFQELLSANIGSTALIRYSSGSNLPVEGEIVVAPTNTPFAAAPELYAERSASVMPSFGSARGEIVVLRTRDGALEAIPVSAIQSVRMMNARIRRVAEQQVSQTRLRFDSDVADANVSVLCLQKGWTWSPSYLLNLVSEREVDVTLEAVLANDVEDITDADVSFAVGYPNFAFAEVQNLLSTHASVGDFLRALANRRQGRVTQDFAMMAQNAVVYSPRATVDPNGYSPVQFNEGQSAEDLFLYQQPKVSLSKGGRSRFVLMTARVPYEHIYEWRLKDVSAETYFNPNPSANPGKENEVWHTLRLKNTTQQPWTTAAAFALRNQVPVAQDILNYTPPGATNTLKITVASDLRATQRYTEQSREQVNVLGTLRTKVVVVGELAVQNLKSIPVRVSVLKEVSGDILNSGEASVLKKGREVNALNISTELEWTFTLPPGKEQKLRFEYSQLTR